MFFCLWWGWLLMEEEKNPPCLPVSLCLSIVFRQQCTSNGFGSFYSLQHGSWNTLLPPCACIFVCALKAREKAQGGSCLPSPWLLLPSLVCEARSRKKIVVDSLVHLSWWFRSGALSPLHITPFEAWYRWIGLLGEHRTIRCLKRSCANLTYEV